MKWILKNIAREINRENFRLIFFYIRNYGLFYMVKMGFLKLLNVGSLHQKPAKPEIFYPMEAREMAFPHAENPLVSIIIPVHNEWAYTFPCLYSILKNSGDVDYEVILADDASTDGTRGASRIVKNLKVMRNEENLGFLKNCNKAAGTARGKYILFLNNDTNVQKDWLRHLVETCERDERAGMVGAKLIYLDGKLQEAGGIVWKDGSAWNYGRGQNPMMPEYSYLKEADYVSGAGIMIRKSLWDGIGGFDERYSPAYSEDSDLAFEVRKRGYKVLFQPASVIVHFEGKSHGTDVTSGIKQYQVINQQKFIAKWGEVLEREQLEPGEDVFRARDRSRGKKTMLVIDHYVPEFDRDAGSRTVFQYLRLFVEMGLNVKFIGDDFHRREPYAGILEQMGIETLLGPYYREKWRDWIKKNARCLDYVLLSRPDVAIKYLDFIKKHTRAKIIYYGHDLHYVRELRRYESEGDRKALKASRKWKELEFKVVGGSDVVLTLSEVEKGLMEKEFPSKEVATFPVFICDSVPGGGTDFKEREGLLFVAGFAHTPNVDGILWFAKNIFPAVLEKIPEMKLYIVGGNPPEAVSSLASSNIIIKGYLSDHELLDLYGRVKIVVIPLRYGAGVKGKTIEAMYYGTPIVSTRIGTEGLANLESIIRPRDTGAEFAEEIIRIYGDGEKLARMGRSYKAYIKEYCSRERAMSIMERVLASNAR